MSATSLQALKRELARAADPDRAARPIWFKTGKGDYGEGDRFIGVRVPILRGLAGTYRGLDLQAIDDLLASRIHEHRYVGVLILVDRYQVGSPATRRRVFDFYLWHTQRINSWDLVDVSAPYVVGAHLVSRSRRILYRLARSPDWWERRIAIIATAAFIDLGELEETFAIAALLLDDRHDLIHKAVGWMLREAGVQSRPRLLRFLKQNYSRMPRTALRYAIEHLPKAQRKKALDGSFD